MIGDIDAEALWDQRMKVFLMRKPSYVLRTLGAPIVIIIIPLLVGGFSKAIVLGAALAGGGFVAYGLVVFGIWRSTETARSGARLRLALIASVGYYALTLLFVSLVFLASALMSLGWVTEQTVPIAMVMLITYLAMAAAATILSPRILHFLATIPDKPLAPEMRWLLSIPSAIIGAGIAFASIVRFISFSDILFVGLGSLGAFLLLPFAVITLLQIPLLARHPVPSEREHALR